MRFIPFAIFVTAILALIPAMSASHDTALTVLFVQNHNEVYNLEGEDLLSLQNFAALLTDQGVNVVSIKRGAVDDEVLNGVDVLVLSFPQTNLTEGEIEAIMKYVEDGGGLLVLGGQIARSYVNPLITNFGIEMGYGVLDRDGNLDFVFPAGDHEIFAHVDEFEYYHAPVVRVENRSWIVYPSPMFGDDWAVFAAREYGKGRVVATGDADFINIAHIDAYDNAQLGYNLVRYTAGTQPVELETMKRFNLILLLITVAALFLLLVRKVF